MLAIAAMIATSCVQDQDLDLGVNAGGETVAVSFNLDTPTRAYSDGSTATVLQYAIYDANGNELVDLTKTNGEIHGSTTVTLQLVTGNTYTAIFWAAAPNAPYTVDFANKKVTVDYTAPVCNDEDRDAFFCHTAPFTVDGAMTVEAKLYRPFAQINIGVSDYDLATAAGFTPTHSAVKVSNAYNTLNLWDGSVEGETAVTFASAEIEKDEVFPVTGYEYLAMNYILVNEQETIEVEFSYTNENTTGQVVSTKTCNVGSVPVQRNYRTNIYGAILTSNVDIKVEIVPGYEEPAHEVEALYLAAAFGGEVTLTEDVVLTKPLAVQANMTINLNGKTISGAIAKSVGHVIMVEEGVTLTLVGGKVESTANNGGSALYNKGTLVVEGTEVIGASIRENGGWPSYPINNYGEHMTLKNVTITGYQGAVACNAAGTTVLENCNITKEYLDTSSHVFFVANSDAEVIINGGTYVHKGMDGSLAYISAGTVTVNNGEFSTSNGGYGMAALTAGTLVVKGGVFNNAFQNWGGSISVSGGVFSANPTNYLAAGYKVVNQNNKYYVIANDSELVSSSAQFSDALAAGQNVHLASDVNIAKIDLTTVSNDVVIDGNGHAITTSSSYGVEVTAGKNITLKNAEVVITVDGNYINYAAGFKISNGDYAGKTIKLENCVIRMANTDWAYAVTMPASVKNLNLVIDNCVLEGAIALQCWGDDNTITVTDSKLICNYTTNALYTSYCVALQGDGSYNSENNVLAISNCEFSYSGVDNFNSEISSVYAHGFSNTNTITVSDCTYVGVTAY